MKTRIHRVCRAGFTASRLAFFLIILAALSSCATHQSAQASSGHLVFRSDEYIICKLKSNETPDALAGRFLNDTQKSWIIEDANEGARFTTGETIVIPLQQENIGGVMANGYQTVPVVGYNQFSEHCEGRSSCITTHVFEQQMKYLQDNGYRVIAMNKFLDFLYYRGAIPKRSVVITIDGNHKSAYDIAYPILKKYAYPSTIFIYPDTIGTEETSLTWDQLKQLMADGFEVGCFAFSNKETEMKNEKEDDQAYMSGIKKTLILWRQVIEKKLSQKAPYLAFLSGKYNENLLNITDQAGYKIAFTMEPGSNPFFSDPLTLKRNMILQEDMETFIAGLKTFYKTAGSQ